ncbi:MAG: hypothetical protein OXF94_06375 [Gammaproteobacteria bacterium]|nr:hypothetical protein [Gammaproteobacteria bacterium]
MVSPVAPRRIRQTVLIAITLSIFQYGIDIASPMLVARLPDCPS